MESTSRFLRFAESRGAAARLTIVKVGGGLAPLDPGFTRVGAAIAAARRRAPLAVMPGGGPFADAVRAFDRAHGLSDAAAHWMAILAMDQYAYALADRLEGAVVTHSLAELGGIAARGALPVFAPAAWLRAADTLPRSWNATSDSAAAYLAGAVDAVRLVLIKPVGGAVDALVDECFAATLPPGIPAVALGWDQVERLPDVVGEAPIR